MEVFRNLDIIPFLENVVREQIPALIDILGAIGKCLSVPWQWVRMQEVVLTGFCTPTALLSPENTIDVYSLLWCSKCTQVRPNRPG